MRRTARILFAAMTIICGMMVVSSGLEGVDRCQGSVRPESWIEVICGLGLFIIGIVTLKRDALQK